MANTTIPNLPEQTGKTDDDLLVIVNSGETTTSKIKVSTLLEGIGGSSFFTATTENTSNVLQTDRGHNIFFNDPSNNPLINDNFFLGGSGNTIDDETYLNNNFNRNIFIGGKDNLVGTNANGARTDDASFIGGESHFIDRAGSRSSFVGGFNNQINYGGNNFLGGGENNNMAQQDAAILGGNSNFVGSSRSVVLGGFSNYIRTTSGSISGYDNYINSYNRNGNSIVGGTTNYMANTNECFIGGGINNDIVSTPTIPMYSAIIGGDTNYISGHTNSVIVGGSGFTSNHDNEVIVPTMTIGNYSILNFSGDTAAGVGGVPLGGVYQNNGELRVRLT